MIEEKNITATMAREAIERQPNESEVEAVFRLHIIRFWSRERIENFCRSLLSTEQEEVITYPTSPARLIYVTPKGSIPPILRLDEEK